MKTGPTFVLAFILVLGLAGSVQAEMGTDLWTNIHDGTYGNDYSYDVAIDSQGNVIAAGWVTGDPGPPDHGTNAYAIKYDRGGNPTGWSVEVDSGVIGGGGGADALDLFRGVAVDSQDNMIFVGIVAEIWPNLPTNQSMLIQKYNSSGVFQWEERYYDYGWAVIEDVFIDANDDIYVTGNLFTNWGPVAGQWATLKYSKNGGDPTLGPILYDYSGMSFLQDRSHGLAVDGSGNIYVVGVRGESGTEGGATNDYDWHVRKYNSTGTLVWSDTYAGAASLYDYAWEVALDSGGNPIVVGYTNKGTDNYDNSDYDWLVIKYSKTGVEGVGQRLWTYTYESAAGRSEACYGVDIDPDDNVLVGGYEEDSSQGLHWRLTKLNGATGAYMDHRSWIGAKSKNLLGMDYRKDFLALVGVRQTANDNTDMRTSLMNLPYGPLTRLNCLEPANESVVSSAPTFMWTVNGGTANRYAVDMSLNYLPPIYSTWDTFHITITDQTWAVTTDLWNRVPTGSYVYWRMRGADTAVSPLSIVTGDDIFWFYKP